LDYFPFFEKLISPQANLKHSLLRFLENFESILSLKLSELFFQNLNPLISNFLTTFFDISLSKEIISSFFNFLSKFPSFLKSDLVNNIFQHIQFCVKTPSFLIIFKKILEFKIISVSNILSYITDSISSICTNLFQILFSFSQSEDEFKQIFLKIYPKYNDFFNIIISNNHENQFCSFGSSSLFYIITHDSKFQYESILKKLLLNNKSNIQIFLSNFMNLIINYNQINSSLIPICYLLYQSHDDSFNSFYE
jgi:hypothetical protein